MSSEGDDDKPPRALLICSACGKSGPPKTCSDCKVEFYCDIKCQKAYWKEHRPICRKIKKEIRTEKEHERIDTARATQILQDKQQISPVECAVCLEENTSNVPFMRLDCGHFFCYDCLFKYQLENMQGRTRLPSFGDCPMCRTKMPSMQALLQRRNHALNVLAKNASTKERRDEICVIALSELESILQVYPGLPLAWQGLGDTYTILEQHEQAIKAYIRLFNAKGCLGSAQTVDNLEEALKRAPADSIDIDALCQNSAAYAWPNWGPYLCVLTRSYIQNGDYGAARKVISLVDLWNKQCTTPVPGVDYNLAVLQAECCYHLGEYEQALKITEECNDLSVLQADLNKVRARCLKEMGEIEKAVHIMGLLYYCEAPWNETIANENLKLWREMNAEQNEMRNLS